MYDLNIKIQTSYIQYRINLSLVSLIFFQQTILLFIFFYLLQLIYVYFKNTHQNQMTSTNSCQPIIFLVKHFYVICEVNIYNLLLLNYYLVAKANAKDFFVEGIQCVNKSE